MTTFPTRGQKAPNYWNDQLKTYVDEGGERVDHGDVGSTLTITKAGSHEMDLTGDIAITVNTDGDVTMWVHGTGTVTVAGKDYDIDGDEVIVVVTSPRDVKTAYALGASGVDTPPEVIDPPTQPGAVTVDPTADGYNLTWVPSTVAAGYEVQLDGGTWVDIESATPAWTYEDLVSGSSHSGAVRSYNSLGTKSIARAWGPANVDTAGIHDLMLSYDAPLYVDMTQGALADHSVGATHAWNLNFWGTPVTFDGPPVSPGDIGSCKMPAGTGLRGTGDFTAFANNTSITIVMIVENGPNPGGLIIEQLGNAGLSFGDVGNEIMTINPTPHTVVWTRNMNTSEVACYRDGILTAYNSFSWNNQPLTSDFDNKGCWIHSNSSFNAYGSEGRVARFMAIPNYVMPADEALALAQAAGTYGNPR